ncbi:formin-like protein 16 [Trachypithecus francoisi]|uniref:formin-like protein 16 n=1 Tax=Trachypithecus francoisi TaxID=54180 RepID=UPI00141AA20A|nr:formin-like protein 16 [Trachypithecus francoisi]
MQIAAGVSAGMPVGAGRRAKGDPATLRALAGFTVGAKRTERRSPKPHPGRLPALPPLRQRRDKARPLFRRGLGRGGRIRARAFRPRPSRAEPAAHRWFSAREGPASALLYNNRALRAGNAPPCRRGPHPATPPSGFQFVRPAAPGPSAAHWPGRHLPKVTCWLCRAVETFPSTPWEPGARGVQAGTRPCSPHPPHISMEPGVPRSAQYPSTASRTTRCPPSGETGTAGRWQGAQRAGATGVPECPALDKGRRRQERAGEAPSDMPPCQLEPIVKPPC